MDQRSSPVGTGAGDAVGPPDDVLGAHGPADRDHVPRSQQDRGTLQDLGRGEAPAGILGQGLDRIPAAERRGVLGQPG